MFSSVQSLSHVRLCDLMNHSTPGLPVHHHCQSLPKPMSIESVMPSNHLILCCRLLLLPSIFPSIRVFSNESSIRIQWPKYWSFSFNIILSSEHPGLISFILFYLFIFDVPLDVTLFFQVSFEWIAWISSQSKGLSRVFSNTTVQRHQFFSAQLSL